MVHEAVRWADVAATVTESAGPSFESLEYRDTYRDPERLGTGKKSLLLTIGLRSSEGTLTSPQANEVRDRVVAACRERHGAELESVRTFCCRTPHAPREGPSDGLLRCIFRRQQLRLVDDRGLGIVDRKRPGVIFTRTWYASANSEGTRHEYRQVKPQPYSKSP